MSDAEISQNSIRVLQILAANEGASQRDLANKSGLSLGMVNLILKRLTKTGYIKIATLNGRKLRYLLTAKGLAEKTQRSYQYVVRTLRVYDQCRLQIEQLIDQQIAAQRRRFLIRGEGDLAEMVKVILDRKDPSLLVRLSTLAEPLVPHPEETVLDCGLNGGKPLHGISILEEMMKVAQSAREGDAYELV